MGTTSITEKKYNVKTLPVIRNLGGCGSTLVGRILAALPNVFILSETNPRSAYLFNGCLNPVNQLRAWHPELLPIADGIDEFELGYPPSFGGLINKLYDHLDAKGTRLVVRDYNYVDFVGFPFVWPAPNNSSLDQAVKDNFSISDIVLVRHPADQLASLRNHYCMRDLTAQYFVYAYIEFLNHFRGNIIFRYEEIVEYPERQLSVISFLMNLPWDVNALSTFTDVVNITGNMDRVGEKKLSKPQRSDAALWAESQLQKCDRYNRLLEMTGYV
jgi:hypothetical protein